MADVDIGAEMTKVARALNRVKTNGAAAVAAATAIEHGERLADTADDLPDLFRGAAAGSALKRTMDGDVTMVRSRGEGFASVSLQAAPVGSGWPDLRKAIERVYVDGAAVYAAGDLEVSVFRALIGNLDQSLVEYGNKLEAAGLAAPGVLIGDALHITGTAAGKVAEGAAAGVADVGKGATSLVFGGILRGFWPVLILAGVVGAAYVFGPALIARKALGR